MTTRTPLALAAALVAFAPTARLNAQSEPDAPEPAEWRTSHSTTVGGETVEYDAVLGSLILTNDDEEPSGELFYTAYFRTNGAQASSRPLVFAYNGGPGSASFWLHMGIMGPRRVVTPNVGQQAPPPYPVVPNEYTLLDQADIVMIDPIGTGFSRPIGDTPGTDFWGLDEDASSLTQFIRRFLGEYDRWNSPRYLLGESYGTTRSALLGRALQGANIDMNGIVLVSTVLDFNTIIFSEGADVPYIANVPSYAAVAWYHHVIPGQRPAELEPFLEEVEAWALGDYATALLAGSRIDPAQRARVVRQMHEYTGLSEDFIDKADLRVTAPEFEAELLRDQGLVVGRLDARFTGPKGDMLADAPDFDPQSTAISSAYTSAFNDYVRSELGYDGDREYVPSGMAGPWNWNRGRSNGFGMSEMTNVAPDLAESIRRNPELEVLLVTGLYDLATPYFAAVWTMDRLGLPPDLRDNIQRADFPAGHMMYVEQGLLQRWKEVLAAFIDRTSGPRVAS